MAGVERDIIPRAREVLIDIATQKVGPYLRGVYQERLAARAQRRKDSLIVTPKNTSTFEQTTNADKEVDREIRSFWQKAFPDIPLLSEDSGDYRLRDLKPEQLRELPALLVVDPVDGSGRMVRHSKRFSSSFGLLMWGEPVLAVICKPVVDVQGVDVGDRSILWTAEQGKGAFKNDGKIDEQIYVSDTRRLNEAIVSTAYAWNQTRRGGNQMSLDRLIYFVNQMVGTASSVLDIIDVAEGLTDAHVSIGLKPWDMAASSLLVTEAGGRVTTRRGDENWTPFESDMLASNGVIHKDLRNIINKNAILIGLLVAYRIIVLRDVRNRGLLHSIAQQVGKTSVSLSKMRNSGK